MWEKKNVRDGCNTDGYLDKLESIQEQLELCKKSLADFLDGRRRQFPRYYFVSEADLLDILSNGSDPNKILVHTPKVRSDVALVWSSRFERIARISLPLLGLYVMSNVLLAPCRRYTYAARR